VWKVPAVIVVAVSLSACDKPSPAAPATPKGSATPAAARSASYTYIHAFARIRADQSPLTTSVAFSPDGAALDPAATGSLEQALDALKQQQQAVAELIKASALAECTFSLPHPKAEGFDQDIVLAFSENFRAAARLLNADAARLWTEGDTDGAVARISALYGMSAHAADQQLVLLGLTVVAMQALANQSTVHMVRGTADRKLSDAQRDQLLQAIGRLNSVDPSGLERARKTEGTAQGDVLQRILQSEANSKQDIAATRAALRRRP